MIKSKIFYKTILAALLSGTLIAFLGIFSVIVAASYSIAPGSGNYPIGCTRQIDIMIDASGQSSNAADIEIRFDPTQIDILDSDTGATGTQILEGDAYETYVYNNVNETTGVIRLVGASFNTFLTDQKTYGSIEFEAKPGASTATFDIYFTTPGDTFDSNIADANTSNDLLTNATDGTFTFYTGSCTTDITPPEINFLTPINNQTGVPVNANLIFSVTDDISGINLSTGEFVINGTVYTIGDAEVIYSGSSLSYNFTIDPNFPFPPGSENIFRVTISDNAGNTVTEQIRFYTADPIIPATPRPTVTTDDDDDDNPPYVIFVSPRPFETGIPADANITINVIDGENPIDQGSIRIFINGDEYRIGNPAVLLEQNSLQDLLLTIDPINALKEDTFNVVRIIGYDTAGNRFDREMLFNISQGDLGEFDVELCQAIVTKGEGEQCYSLPVIEEELNNILDQPYLKDLNSRYGYLPVLAGLLFLGSSLLALMGGFGNPSLLFNYILTFFGRRTSPANGVVQDWINMKPVSFAVCSMYHKGSDSKISSALSDREGRFFLPAQPGEYTIEIRKDGFQTVQKNVSIASDIDSVQFDTVMKPYQSLIGTGSYNLVENFRHQLIRLYKYLYIIIFALGAVLSVVSLVTQPNVFSFGVFVLYAITVSYFMNIMKVKSGNSIILNSTTEQPVAFGTTRVFAKDSSRLIDTFVANMNGQTNLNSLPGGYFDLLCSTRGYKFPSRNTPFGVKNINGYNLIEVSIQGDNGLKVYMDPDTESEDSQFKE